MPALRFNIGAAFPADDPVAVWVMGLSVALGDLRTVALYMGRSVQPRHERLYFVRVFASHLREVAKVIDRDFDRSDLAAFVATLPREISDARDRIATRLNAKLVEDDDDTLLDHLKRLRNDTFHYAGDPPSRARLGRAVTAARAEEGVYLLGGPDMRAAYADEVVAERELPGHPADKEAQYRAFEALHEAISALNGDVAEFIQRTEAVYLADWLSYGVVTLVNGD